MKTRWCTIVCLGLVLMCAAPVAADPPRAFLVRDDFGAEPLYDCYLNYYYYIPCPTASWFWAPYLHQGDVIGAWFEVGDPSMGSGAICDPSGCFSLERVRFLEFTGYANYPRYPDLFAVEYDIYCADEYGCPVGPALWHNDNLRSQAGWTYIDFNPPLSLCSCTTQPGGGARVLITMTTVGGGASYIEWGFDNICFPLKDGWTMHDIGCSPVLYPRPTNSHYGTMHSGYYGNGGFQYCPPIWVRDGCDTSTSGPGEYGYIEMAVRIYMACTGPSDAQPVTWGQIKSLYR